MSPAPPLGTEVDTMEVENVYAAVSNNNKKSNDPTIVETTTTTSSGATADDAVLFSPQLLQMYYKRLFPFSFMYDWLSYGGGGIADNNNKNSCPAIFSRREFSFTIDANGQEIYIRYQSFQSQKELEQAIIKRCPNKIDIGAVFSLPPKDKNSIQANAASGAFQPIQRELVFDIDLTDYDEIRKCGCSGAKICPVCWKFMQMAVCVMDIGLRQDFGWHHIAWFYSGRRGVHAWVCDESARHLTDQGRSAVAKYFEVELGTDKNKEVKLSHPLHPMLKRSYEMLEPMFIEQVIPESGHGLLANEENWNMLLDSIPESASKVRTNLTESWRNKNKNTTPQEKWQELKMHMQAFCKKTTTSGGSGSNTNNKQVKTMTSKEKGRLENWPAEVVFRYTYPRLDINVSKMRNHLLKSPFCVHPKTGRVCVPIQPDKMCDFDPFCVPTLPQLMKELDEYEAKNSTTDDDTAAAMETTEDDSPPVDDDVNDKQRCCKKDATTTIPNWQKTSLKSYFEPFVKEFLEPLQKELRRDARDEAEKVAAASGDF